MPRSAWLGSLTRSRSRTRWRWARPSRCSAPALAAGDAVRRRPAAHRLPRRAVPGPVPHTGRCSRCRAATCPLPSERRSPSSTPRVTGCARSLDGSAGLRRRSRGSYVATLRPVAARWSIGPRPLSGTPIGVPGVRKWRSSPPTTRCASTCRIVSRGCRCGSRTRRSTRRCTCRAGVRCAVNSSRAFAPAGHCECQEHALRLGHFPSMRRTCARQPRAGGPLTARAIIPEEKAPTPTWRATSCATGSAASTTPRS